MWRALSTVLVTLGLTRTAVAQISLYSQRLPEGTVYIRLASALPEATSVTTGFAGTVALGADGASRISPYYVAGDAGGKAVTLQVSQSGRTLPATFTPNSGSFVTVVLHGSGAGVVAAVVTDKPEYNQLRARLSFYNATADCGDGSLVEGAGSTASRTIFSAMPANSGQARSINPVAARVTAGCATGRAPALDLGTLEPGGLYSVWLIQPANTLTAFAARDTIAPPQN